MTIQQPAEKWRFGIFKHDSEMGNAPAYKLFETVTVERKNPETPARSYGDYRVEVKAELIPEGVTCLRRS